jgi:hypothetical protein
MPQISKEQIEEIKESLWKGECDDLERIDKILDELLDPLEGAPVARLMTCKKPLLVSVETIARTYEEFPTERAVSEGFWAEGSPLYTHSTPFTPITADDVTDEMVTAYHTTTSSSKEAVMRIVNAYLGSKK